ncbi:sedoheptulokinase [Paenibacillus flagellatus]|nr:FGGY family carbohydrate kinase [Paenibacillus flagellatus]
MLWAGLDIGTTSVSIVLTDAATGVEAYAASRPNRSWIPGTREDERLQDPERIWRTVEDVLRDIGAYRPAIAGVGGTGQMHGIVYVNRGGRHASPLYTWQDRRGDRQRFPAGNAAASRSGGGGRTYAEWLSEATSSRLAAGYGLVTHAWNAANGALPDEPCTMCTIGDYVAMRLAGRTEPIIDATNAASLGGFDLERGRFDPAAAESAGAPPGALPAVVPSNAPVGRTEDGIPVYNAIGDNQASFLGAVHSVSRSVLVNVGTGSQVSAYAGTYGRAEGLELRPFPGGGYLWVGASINGGKAYALLESFFRDVVREMTGAEPSGDLYEAMNRLAERDAGGRRGTGTEAPPLIRTTLLGTREEPGLTGAIDLLTERNFTASHLVRGFLEGMARELLAYYDRFPEDVKRGSASLVGAGNGLRGNPGLRRSVSEAFGLPLRIAPREEEAAYGAALHAAVSHGAFASYEEAVRAWYAEEDVDMRR